MRPDRNRGAAASSWPAHPRSADAVAAPFAEAFGPPPARALTEGAPFQARLDGWRGDHVLVCALERSGDFPFTAPMNFHRPVDVGGFDATARTQDGIIASATDGRRSYDDTCHIVDRAGTTTRKPSFGDTGTLYARTIVGDARTADGWRS